MQLLGKSNRSTVQRLLLTCFVICIAVFLRTWQFSDIPSTPYIDEVAMLVDAKALVATGSDMHGNHWLQALFPSYGDYKLPLYIWFASLFSAVLGPSAFTIRLPSLLAGLLTLLLAGVLLWNIVSVSYARRKSSFLAYLSALVVVGLSPWAIQFSRTGFEAHVGQLFLGVSLYFLFVSKKRWEYYLLSALVAAVATYTYFSVRYVWAPVFLVWYLLQPDVFSKPLGASRTVIVSRILKGVLPLVLFGILLLPMLKSPLYVDSMQFRLSTPSVLQNTEQIVRANEYRAQAGGSIVDRLVFHRYYFTAQSFLKNLSEQLSLSFFFVSGDVNLRHGTGVFGLFLLPFIVPYFVGWYQLIKRNWRISAVIAVWIFSAAVPAAIPHEVPHALRFLNALLPISLVIALGLYEILLYSLEKKQAFLKRMILAAVSVVLIVFSVGRYTTYYFGVYPERSAESWDRSKTELATALSPYLNEQRTVYLVGLPDKMYLWLLAYGPYSGSEFQYWQSNGYQFDTMGDVQVGSSELDVGDRVVVSQSAYTPSLKERVTELQKITVSDGQLFFVLEVVE